MTYLVKITKLEDGKEEVVHEEEHKNVNLLAEDLGGKKITEIMLNDNLFELAAKIGSSTQFKKAAILMHAMDKVMDSMREDSESDLINRLLGGND